MTQISQFLISLCDMTMQYHNETYDTTVLLSQCKFSDCTFQVGIFPSDSRIDLCLLKFTPGGKCKIRLYSNLSSPFLLIYELSTVGESFVKCHSWSCCLRVRFRRGHAACRGLAMIQTQQTGPPARLCDLKLISHRVCSPNVRESAVKH